MIQVRKVIVIYWIFTSPSIDLDLKCQVIMMGFADQATSSLNSSCDYKSLHISPSPDNLSAVCFPNNPLPLTWFLAKNTTRKLRFTPKLVIFSRFNSPLQAFFVVGRFRTWLLELICGATKLLPICHVTVARRSHPASAPQKPDKKKTHGTVYHQKFQAPVLP